MRTATDRKQAPQAEPCGWCEGRGIVGKIVPRGGISLMRVGGDLLPIKGEIIDRPCGRCGGTGREGGGR